ncbi:MAG TPA: hypothetical protein VG253_04735 [Streptosporangiaceae bacterium]|nr:hypothetical protein [Streptosporangiaceae bacterium]
MTSQEREYEETIRSALFAAARSVEPAGDGLDRIQRRLSAPRSTGSVLADLGDRSRLAWIRISVRFEPATEACRRTLRPGSALRVALAAAVSHLWLAVLRLRPLLVRLFVKGDPPRDQRDGTPPIGPARSWIRPLVAVAGAVAIVVIGVLALGHVRQPINQTNNAASAHRRAIASAGSAFSIKSRPAPVWSPLGVKAGLPHVAISKRHHGAVVLAPQVACSATPKPTASTTPASPTPTSTSPSPIGSPTSDPSPTITPTGPSPSSSSTSTGTGTGTGTGTSTGAGISAVLNKVTRISLMRAEQPAAPCAAPSPSGRVPAT